MTGIDYLMIAMFFMGCWKVGEIVGYMIGRLVCGKKRVK